MMRDADRGLDQLVTDQHTIDRKAGQILFHLEAIAAIAVQVGAMISKKPELLTVIGSKLPPALLHR